MKKNSIDYPGVSIVLCCYNSAKRLPTTLSYLAAQEIYPGMKCEAIVIDNASTDETSQVARQHWPSNAPFPLRVVREPRPGLSQARVRGLKEAVYPVVSFIDDDNWICSDWIARVAEIFHRRPDVGVCGGKSEGVFEQPPPGWFQPFAQYLAISQPGDAPGDITNTRGIVWGAGMSVRKAAWEPLARRGFKFWLSDRVGTSLISGGDVELCLALRLDGWRVWYDPKLHLRHYMPAGRLNWEYLLRLAHSGGQTAAWREAYFWLLRDREQPVRPLLRWLSEIRRLMWLLIRRRPDLLLVRQFREREGSVSGFNHALALSQLREVVRHRRELTEQWRQLFRFFNLPARQEQVLSLLETNLANVQSQ